MARAPRQTETGGTANSPVDPVASGPTRGASDLVGTPSSPTIDPRAVTTAGQVLSPPGPPISASDNMSWGPIPVLTDGMTFWELGQTGLRQFSGWVREEFLQTLIGRQGAQKFREMRDNDAQVGGMLFAIEATMRKVEWRVDPAAEGGGGKEFSDFIESCMHDMSSSWAEVVSDHLSYLTYGFSWNELVYKKRLGRKPGMDPRYPSEELPASEYDDGKVGWRRMPGRSQDTIIKWFFDRNGQTKGVTQQPWVGPLIDMPIDKAILHRPTHYKNNPEGRSILRNSYVAYYYKKRLQEQEAILFERLGGVPVIYIPGEILQLASKGDGDALAQVSMYKRIAINLRTDEQMGLVLPSTTYEGATGPTAVQQYRFELVAPQMRAASINLDQTITRYSTSMLTSVLADFLTLGHEARGTQSLAVTKVDMFMQAIEGYLNAMAQVYNKYAVTRLMDFNGMDLDMQPKIAPDLAQRVDLDVLSNYVLRMAQAGMPLFPDEEVQTYLKDAAGLPDIDDSRAMQAAGLLPEQLDMKDEQSEVQLDQMKNPPMPVGAKPGGAKPPPSSDKQQKRENLEMMLKGAIAQRMVRHAGPKFGIRTGHVHKKQPSVRRLTRMLREVQHG
jgi:hypothetical protein